MVEFHMARLEKWSTEIYEGTLRPFRDNHTLRQTGLQHSANFRRTILNFVIDHVLSRTSTLTSFNTHTVSNTTFNSPSILPFSWAPSQLTDLFLCTGSVLVEVFDTEEDVSALELINSNCTDQGIYCRAIARNLCR